MGGNTSLGRSAGPAIGVPALCSMRRCRAPLPVSPGSACRRLDRTRAGPSASSARCGTFVPQRHEPCRPCACQVLIQRFEGLLDRVLRQEAHQAQAAEGGVGSARARDAAALAAAAGPQLKLSTRSLAVSFWALGTMKHPLRQELLDKIAGRAGGGASLLLLTLLRHAALPPPPCNAGPCAAVAWEAASTHPSCPLAPWISPAAPPLLPPRHNRPSWLCHPAPVFAGSLLVLFFICWLATQIC